MRVVHVVDSLGPEAAGVANVAAGLIRAQRNLGGNVRYVTRARSLQSELVPGVPQWGSLPRRIWDAVRQADVVHIHALWLWSTWMAAAFCMIARRPYVLSVHGMLDPWGLAQSQLKKLIARTVFEDRVISGASCLHALSPQEESVIRSLGFSTPIAVVPPGVEMAESLGSAREGPQRILLFLGRIHPKKGPDLLVRAFMEVAAEHPRWRLRFAGPDQVGITRELRGWVQSAGLQDRVEFLGPVYGNAKARVLSEADAFVLPSHSEGVPIAVLEAMAHGLPVVVSDACNLPEVGSMRAGFVGKPNVESIAGCLRDLMRRDASELRAMGAHGRAVVEERFSIEGSARRLMAVYEWVAGNRCAPDDVAPHGVLRHTEQR